MILRNRLSLFFICVLIMAGSISCSKKIEPVADPEIEKTMESEKSEVEVLKVDEVTPQAPEAAPVVEVVMKKSYQNVLQDIETSPFMDKVHIDAGLNCQSCHGELDAEGQVTTVPTTEDCLSCHGGDYRSFGKEFEEEWGEQNPHWSHQGELDCTACHSSHKSFELYCNTCHSFSMGSRFN
jgi:hypothetical protein